MDSMPLSFKVKPYTSTGRSNHERSTREVKVKNKLAPLEGTGQSIVNIEQSSVEAETLPITSIYEEDKTRNNEVKSTNNTGFPTFEPPADVKKIQEVTNKKVSQKQFNIL